VKSSASRSESARARSAAGTRPVASRTRPTTNGHKLPREVSDGVDPGDARGGRRPGEEKVGRDQLRRDYDAMKGTILGAAPAFDEVVAAVAALEFD